MPTINIYPDARRTAAAFAVFLIYLLQRQERLTVALSGGSTPQLLFRLLAEDYRTHIDWSKLHLFWGDERCVGPRHPDSNYGVADELLLRHVDLPPENVHRIHGEEDPGREAERYAGVLREFLPLSPEGMPLFDLVLLGLGEDGHTASIFPGQHELLSAPSLCAVARHPGSGQARITLTGPVINQARHVVFLVTGAGKAQRVREVVRREGDWQRLPAAYIEPANGALYWFLDRAAAGELGEE